MARSPTEEHRRVFNYMPSTRSSTVPQFKRKKGKGKTPYKPCTFKFFCLGKTDDISPPQTVAGKAFLSNCGLGPASLVVDLNGESVHEALLERFPVLSSAGGYELLLYQRGGAEQGFHKIPMPHTPSRIRELVGQAQIYIRPLQMNIDEVINDNVSDNKVIIQLAV